MQGEVSRRPSGRTCRVCSIGELIEAVNRELAKTGGVVRRGGRTYVFNGENAEVIDVGERNNTNE